MATATMQTRGNISDLVLAHQAGIWRYLRFLGADEGEADDLTQETFLAVLKQPFEDRGPAAAGAYLRAVARNLFLMAVRKSGRDPAGGSSTQRGPALADLELAEEVWAKHAGDGGNAYLDALAECLETLAGKARSVVEMRYQHERSRDEIAQALEMTEDGIKTLLRRTREVLRRCVERKLES
jgi:RNA polymerase sigma-70 factor (ECF subfamily)